ncbi:MAG: hypothetical protein A2452_12570 [Candidatus Firestonebacteria bacterium RIFOXYC2_FULL_39_67]|nr:MAG: hypothetical protein A2536_05710 [Candidatus Firestonebacteria bacterium RIFOXYD2_FULL_39_29]OGF57399.1 MAG: hypothetical protein A2452_12570 [Candidatus Firestonebacteria bacterium RIFOXYC2_FULL_39_67]
MLKYFLKSGIFLVVPVLVFSLSFGKNKVNYKQLEWKELPTNNFEIYFASKDETLVKEFAIYAEDAYAKLSENLKVTPPSPVRLFIYDTHLEFEQTNISTDLIDEGVGGFTESLKNRIVLPVVTSPKRMKEVITHELTHELQFESLYGGFAKSYQFAKALFIPIWVMEGMAEHEALDYDPSITDMLLRDAALNNKVKNLSELGSFNYIDGHDVVLMYKESQYVFDYISKTYGEDKISLMLKEFGYLANIQEAVISRVLKVEFNDFDKKWQYDLREKYFAQAKGKKDAADFAVRLTNDDGLRPVYNTRPVFSSDGEKIYFLSDRYNYTGLYELVIKTGEVKELVGKWYDSFSQSGNALSVSKDGKYLAFVSKSAGTQKLRIWDIKERRVIAENTYGLDLVFSPCFGSENKLVFIGVKDGKSDVYLGNIKGEITSRLTKDRNDETEAVFGANGEDVYYVSERENGFRQLYRIKKGESKCERLEAPNGNNYNISGPVVSSDGKIFYTADCNGIYNLYMFDPAKRINASVLSDVKGGIFSPDVSPDRKKIVFSYFENSCYNLYLMDNIEEKKLSSVAFEPLVDLSGFGKKDYNLTNFQIVPYKFSLSMDLVYFVLGYDSTAGLLGGGYLSMSDLLGENSFEFYALGIKEYQTGAQFTYRNTAYRVNFALALYSWRNYGISLFSDNTIAGKYYTEEDGVSLPLIYPFDRNTRVELAVNSYIKDHCYYEGDGNNYRTITNSISLAFVFDNLTYNIDTPCGGSAFALNAERADYLFWGTRKFLNLEAEDQEYLFIDKENTLAFRFFAGISLDTDAGYFNLGAENLRGYPAGENTGSNLLLSNIELRFTLIEKADVSVWPTSWLLIKKVKAVLFSDQGAAFNNYSYIGPGDLKNGVGFGIRIHTFLWQSYPVIFRFDMGFRTDGGSPSHVYYIGLGNVF